MTPASLPLDWKAMFFFAWDKCPGKKTDGATRLVVWWGVAHAILRIGRVPAYINTPTMDRCKCIPTQSPRFVRPCPCAVALCDDGRVREGGKEEDAR